MTCVSLELFQMGGGVLSSLTPFSHEHSWAVLLAFCHTEVNCFS